jgi:hypothetical protein
VRRVTYRWGAAKHHATLTGWGVCVAQKVLFEAVHGLVRDDFDPYRRKLAKVPVEKFMTERFADIPVPPTAAEQLALRERLKQLLLRARGEAVKTALPFAEADLAAFVRAMSDDAEAKQLFCLNRTNASAEHAPLPKAAALRCGNAPHWAGCFT